MLVADTSSNVHRSSFLDTASKAFKLWSKALSTFGVVPAAAFTIRGATSSSVADPVPAPGPAPAAGAGSLLPRDGGFGAAELAAGVAIVVSICLLTVACEKLMTTPCT